MSGLTLADVQELRRLLGTSWDDPAADRGAFYLLYYELIKGSEVSGARQILMQAQISTYSGFFGGAALLGNAMAKFANPDIYTRSIDEFSWIIADNLLNEIEKNLVLGGSGVFSAEKIQELDRFIWSEHGRGRIWR